MSRDKGGPLDLIAFRSKKQREKYERDLAISEVCIDAVDPPPTDAFPKYMSKMRDNRLADALANVQRKKREREVKWEKKAKAAKAREASKWNAQRYMRHLCFRVFELNPQLAYNIHERLLAEMPGWSKTDEVNPFGVRTITYHYNPPRG